jgi:hypothetical protein
MSLDSINIEQLQKICHHYGDDKLLIDVFLFFEPGNIFIQPEGEIVG